MNKDTIVKLEHFFTVDKKIKEEMYKMCPPDYNGYLDDDSLIKYIDNGYEALDYIFSELKCVAKDLFGVQSSCYQKTAFLEKTVKNYFVGCGIDIKKLRVMYKCFISNMDSEFLDAVKVECIGYSSRFISKSLEKVSTVNELLHLFHSYILNSDELFNSIPLTELKVNNYNCPIRLRGNENPFFQSLFANFPNDLDCGDTDFIVINDNKLIMMVRDRGHALSIEISIKKNIARVEYFIPKLCNKSMINSLPGVNKVSIDSDIGTTGSFEVEKDLLQNILFDFISKVPTDYDMEFVNTTIYHR